MPWLILLACLVAVLGVMLSRTGRFNPKETEKAAPLSVETDLERAVNSLSRMVQIPTLAANGSEPFEKFRALLKELYPHLHETCELNIVGSGGLLYRWKGQSDASPSVFMAHYDVVPADAGKWSKPPFCGIRENGELWGRGTLDTKGTLCCALETAEKLIKSGHTPKNDIYFSFGSDEETTGLDAQAVVAWLKSRNITPGLVLDEGGAVVDGVFPGVSAPCALIGTAEKGMLDVDFTLNGAGGHASAPPPHSPVGVLAQAVTRVENKPFDAHICEPAAQMFDTLGRHSSFLYRFIFANLWCFKPVLSAMTKKAGGELNALMRTTVAFTRMKGSEARNVLPPTASVSANLRLMSPDTVETAVARLKSLVANDAIEVSVASGNNPSRFSDTSSEGYKRLCTAIEQTWPDAIVSPYLMVACSDSRFFSREYSNVYRFSAMALTKEDRGRIHGNDERIREKTLGEALAFYMRIMKNS